MGKDDVEIARWSGWASVRPSLGSAEYKCMYPNALDASDIAIWLKPYIHKEINTKLSFTYASLIHCP